MKFISKFRSSLVGRARELKKEALQMMQMSHDDGMARTARRLSPPQLIHCSIAKYFARRLMILEISGNGN